MEEDLLSQLGAWLGRRPWTLLSVSYCASAAAFVVGWLALRRFRPPRMHTAAPRHFNLASLAGLVVAAWLIVELVDEIGKGEDAAAFDTALTAAMADSTQPWIDSAFGYLTRLGDTGFLAVLVVATALYLAGTKQYWQAMILAGHAPRSRSLVL